jgi:hypothetical protein
MARSTGHRLFIRSGARQSIHYRRGICEMRQSLHTNRAARGVGGDPAMPNPVTWYSRVFGAEKADFGVPRLLSCQVVVLGTARVGHESVDTARAKCYTMGRNMEGIPIGVCRRGAMGTIRRDDY